MVIRKSDFLDDRTFATRCNLASKDIDRSLIESLQSKGSNANVLVEKCNIKTVLFDFDGTLEKWHINEKHADEKIVKVLEKKLKAQKEIAREEISYLFEMAKLKFIHGFPEPKYHGRDIWIEETLRMLDCTLSKTEIDELVELYWQDINKRVELYPGSLDLLRSLRKRNYRIIMFSDSDGKKDIKMKRIKKLRIGKYFDAIYTSDDSKINKPHIECYEWLLKKEKLDPHEVITIGDHPKTDHSIAKTLGMSTVWVKQGEFNSNTTYPYVDYTIHGIKNVLRIIDKLE